MGTGVVADGRGFDPIAYVRAVGLRPEDCYGFLPVELEDRTPYLYLYRDRPEYERARAELTFDDPSPGIGPIPIDPAQRVEMEVEQDLPGRRGFLGRMIAGAQELSASYGGNPGAVPQGAPDAAELVRLAQLRSAGTIDDAEYMSLVSAAMGTATPGGAGAATPPGGGPASAESVAAHRIYPPLGRRSSTRQLDDFLPRYRDTLGLRPEDTYGVLPRRTRTATSGGEAADRTEWDDFWIVYRDRPEYGPGREAWAREMDADGRWPAAVVAAGTDPAPAPAAAGGRVRVERDLWPRHTLVVRERAAEDLGESLRERIAKRGYEPEDSFGLCPNFANRSIYSAWVER